MNMIEKVSLLQPHALGPYALPVHRLRSERDSNGTTWVVDFDDDSRFLRVTTTWTKASDTEPSTMVELVPISSVMSISIQKVGDHGQKAKKSVK